MRKVKKINGYLVVRFNEREKQGYPQLGSFGVIDAEMYTGCIDTDLGAMEYEDADTLEVAVEQARGLESEQDYSGDPPVCTLIVETADETTEEEVDPQLMIAGFEKSLQKQAAHGCRDMDARTAAHELYGYKAALRDLGLLEPEEVQAHICDHVCPAPQAARDQEELDAVCGRCPAFGPPQNHFQETAAEPRDTFRHLDPALRGALPVRAAYRLGLALERDCPDNDCRVYRNIFRTAQELDTALDGLDENGAPALYLRKALRERVSELKEMYTENHAVRKYRENQKEPPDKQTAPGHEPPQAAPPCAGACAELKEHLEQMLQNPAPTGELKRAQAALERTIILVQEHAGEDERRKLISDLGTFGRLLERETARPDVTQAQTLARLACGILDGSVHLFPRPEEGGRIQVALLDTIRREEAAQLTFREMGGGYFIETVEAQPTQPR